MATTLQPIRYGLVGAGSFGSFCIEHYRKSPLIEVRAVADVNADAAKAMAAKLGIEAVASAEAIFARDDIDLVHLATPPFTHRDLTLQALAAGKHVLCEKPLATSVEDARVMLEAAAKAKRVLVVNLIMRYDPLNEAVARILNEKLLGEPIAASLTNLALDWKLSPTHWFWNREQSGGIFVEHSVHFFDLFEMFFGEARVLSAAQGRRPGNEKIVEQVMSSARHESGVLATQYHGFHQPGEMDRQELRIICEKGDIRLFDWLSTRVTIDAILDAKSADQIAECFARQPTVRESELVPNAPGADAQDVLARHKHFHADARYSFEATLGAEKLTLYGDAVRTLLEDQAMFIRDPSHKRRVSEANGLRSLTMAATAPLARGSRVNTPGRRGGVMRVMRLAKYLWASPTSGLGLTITALALASGGSARVVEGVVETHGGVATFILRKLVPLPGGASAMTLGHVVIGRDADSPRLDAWA